MSPAEQHGLAAALAAVPGIGAVARDDDGALAFRFGPLTGAVHAVALAPGLELATVSCVLAWDLAAEPVRARAAQIQQQVMFGTLRLVERDADCDVLLSYTFPWGGLAPDALTMLLTLVLGGADDARIGLTEGADR